MSDPQPTGRLPPDKRKCNCPSCPRCGKVRCRTFVGKHPKHRGLTVLKNGKRQTEVCKLLGSACDCVAVA